MEQEKRRFERIESLITVRYVSKAGDISGYALTKDCSEGGIGIPTPGSMPKGTELDLAITIMEEAERKIPATAKVAWSKRNNEHWKSRYLSGLEFSDIEPRDKNRILEYVKRNKWIKTDFERRLEADEVPIFKIEGEF